MARSFALTKWGAMLAVFAIIYFTGGFDIFLNNPTFLVFGLLVLVVLAVLKK